MSRVAIASQDEISKSMDRITAKDRINTQTPKVRGLVANRMEQLREKIPRYERERSIYKLVKSLSLGAKGLCANTLSYNRNEIQVDGLQASLVAVCSI